MALVIPDQRETANKFLFHYPTSQRQSVSIWDVLFLVGNQNRIQTAAFYLDHYENCRKL